MKRLAPVDAMKRMDVQIIKSKVRLIQSID